MCIRGEKWVTSEEHFELLLLFFFCLLVYIYQTKDRFVKVFLMKCTIIIMFAPQETKVYELLSRLPILTT